MLPGQAPGTAGQRTVQSCSFFRTIASRAQFSAAKADSSNLFDMSSQTVLVPDAVSTGVRVLQAQRQLYPYKDTWAHDRSSAFPHMHRVHALVLAKNVCCGIFSFLFGLLSVAAVSVFASRSKTYTIKQESGCVAGDVFGSFLYAMAAAPFFVRAKAILLLDDVSSYFRAYADDSTSHASMAASLALMLYFKDVHKQDESGQYLNLLKTKCLMGPRGSMVGAKQDQNKYHDTLGVPLANILIHPDDAGGDNRLRERLEQAYGFVDLGTPVGSDRYIRNFLAKTLEDLKQDLVKLAAYPNTQCQLILLRECFLAKVVHLGRTLPFSPGTPLHHFAERFETLVRSFLCECVLMLPASAISDSAWEQAKLRCGLGLPLLADVATPAYLAATVRAMESIPIALRDRLKDIKVDVTLLDDASPLERALHNALTSFSRAAVATEQDGKVAPSHAGAQANFLKFSVQLLIDQAYKDGVYIKDYQHQLTATIKTARLDTLLLSSALSHEDRVRIRSSLGGVGNSWTRAIPYCDWDPSKPPPLFIPPADCRVAVCRLLGIGLGPGDVVCTNGPRLPESTKHPPGPLWGYPLRCDCAAHSPFDPSLQHAHGCSRDALPTNVHDAIKLTLHQQAQSVKVKSDMEVATGEEVIRGEMRPRKDADVLIRQSLRIPGCSRGLVAIDVKTHGAACNKSSYCTYPAAYFLPSNPANPHLNHMASHERLLIPKRQQRQQANTDFTIYSMDSFGGTTKLSDDILSALAEAGSAKGKWEGKARKLFRKFQTMQSVVLARTYANQAYLRAALLRRREFNVPLPPAAEPPLQLPLSVALAHLTSISF